MNGFEAFLAARHRTAGESNSARPDSPVAPDTPRRGPRVRLRISLAIRKVADRIDPLPAPSAPDVAGTSC